MIILFGDKDFKKFWKEKKNRKIFVGHHSAEPLLVDATDGGSEMLNQMAHLFSLRGYSAAGKLLNGTKKADKTLDKYIGRNEVKKARKKFFKSEDFVRGTLAITKTFIENKGDMNIALIITQDSYDALGKEYIKQIIKLLKLKKKEKEEDLFDIPPKIDDIDDIKDVTKKADVFFTFKEVRKNTSLLKRKPKKKEMKALSKSIEKVTKKLTDK